MWSGRIRHEDGLYVRERLITRDARDNGSIGTRNVPASELSDDHGRIICRNAADEGQGLSVDRCEIRQNDTSGTSLFPFRWTYVYVYMRRVLGQSVILFAPLRPRLIVRACLARYVRFAEEDLSLVLLRSTR